MPVRHAVRYLAIVLSLQTTVATNAFAGEGSQPGQSMRETAEQVLKRLGAIEGSDIPACASCHSLNISNLSQWARSLEDLRWECLDNAESADDVSSWDQAKALRAVRCMSENPNASDLHFHPRTFGLAAAGIDYMPIRDIFLKAFNQSEAEYEKLRTAVVMPPTGHNKLSKEEFENVATWSIADAPFLAEILGNTQFPTTCETNISYDLRQHVLESNLNGWQARNRENGIMMFACPNNDSLNCFTQKSVDGSDLFTNAATAPIGAGWNRDFASTIRILYRIPYATDFWMRSSADGRFVGNGKSKGSDNYRAAIDDMATLLEGRQLPRHIGVKAYYDPSFFVDNSGFLFQGGRTGICSQRILEDTSISHIDWTQPGCTQDNSHAVSLYQSVATSLDSGDLLTVTGTFESDAGSSADRAHPFNSISKAFIQILAHDGTQYRRIGSEILNKPFQGDFAISPSGKILIGRLTGATDNYEQIALGYKFYKLTTSGMGQDMTVEATEVATVCEGGRKGVMSFDERFWTFYKPVEARDWLEFGFQSATDPEFLALVGNSSNVYVTDFLTGITHRVTRMQPGQYAQFPHFRSDNWLVFMVGGHPDQHVAASDAVIRLKSL